MANKRQASIERKTNEVKIIGNFALDGEGRQDIKTPFDSLNHMLGLLVFHGFFDLELKAEGDLSHHIVEDIGIALGDAFRKSLGDTLSIQRFGFGSAPMDEVLANVTVDISGRGRLEMKEVSCKQDNLDLNAGDFRNFLEAFVDHAKITLHIHFPLAEIDNQPRISDTHHYFEALFKALAIALDKACQVDKRRKGVPSTKGVIDL